ncbi:MAG TPA: DUF11 domain-containing protein, partial [Pyrinomonadaceae bacterium]|nr:DUF11 domain-containing protein [Pyrinomonadaceae bacterium]
VTSLPLQVDAAGPFTYKVGSNASFDGAVEVSLDDPAFASPRLATLTTGNNWQLSLGQADITPGSHVVYARERAFGRAPSSPASVPFSYNTGADVSVTMTADRDPAPVGLNFNYQITISNAGPLAATNVVVTDQLPVQVTLTTSTASQGACTFASGTRTVTCQLGTLAKNASATVRLTVKPREEGVLNNTATATLAETDLNPSNNSASVNGLQAVKQTDISVTMTDAPDPVIAGQQVTYTMVVKNGGSAIAATGVVLTDQLPPSTTFVSATTTQGTLVTPPAGSNGIVTANVGSLNVNSTATITVTVKAAQNGTVTNTATANGNEADPNTLNNTATQTTTVNATVGVSKVLLTKQTLVGGCESTAGQVYLLSAAPPGGMLVNLSSTVSGASTPASIVIPAGKNVSDPFPVTTSPVSIKQTGLVNATNGLSTVSRGITINVGSGSCP